MSTFFKIRCLASRRAWLSRHQPGGMERYERVVAHELRRNKTETYTPYWAVTR